MLQPKLYAESRALSQSDIKLFRRSLLDFHRSIIQGARTETRGNKATEIGDIVDAILTNPEALSEYEIVENVKCSDTIKDILTEALSQILVVSSEMNLDAEKTKLLLLDEAVHRTHIVAAGRKFEYYPNYKDESLFNTIWKTGQKYYESIVLHYGKEIIDKEVYDLAVKVANRMKTDRFTAEVLNIENDNNFTVLNQKMFVGTYNGIPQKILPDRLVINEDQKVVFPFDVKTCHAWIQFLTSYYKLGYGYQGSYYVDVLQQNFPDYIIAPFGFLVGFTGTEESPLIYEMDPEEIRLFAEGGFDRAGRRVIGWKEDMERIKWHTDTNQWDYPRDYYEKGKIIIQSTYSETESSDDVL